MTTNTTLKNIEDAITALKDGWASTALTILEEARLDEMAKEQLMKAGIYPPGTKPAAPVQEPVAWVNAVMEQAQVFASAWSLVGSRFDDGSAIDDAEEAKAELRAMLTTQPAAPVQELYKVAASVRREAVQICEQQGYPAAAHAIQNLLATNTHVAGTPPAAQREWVSLTDEQRRECTQSPFTMENYLAIEAKLRELNGGQA